MPAWNSKTSADFSGLPGLSLSCGRHPAIGALFG
jgi:hypothetical protein